MKIIDKNIKELKFADYNPRTLTEKQFKDLKNSINEFGLVDPVIINKNPERKNVIVGGLQRVRVAKGMGMEYIPCVEVNLDLKRERELNVRLNRNVGGWDYDVLADQFDMAELVDWGFSEKNLYGLFDDIDYSILEDDDVDLNMETLKDGTRKAIQIEFKLEDYDEAVKLLKIMREQYDYVGSEVVNFFKSKINE